MIGGHGHVVARPDGMKARCGGPALCRVCAAEQARTGEAKGMTRDQLRDVNKLVAEYEHPGALPKQRLRLREYLWTRYRVVVDELEGTSG